jgi:hypothetical protein
MKKCLAIGIILLTVGTSVLPNITGEINTLSDKSNKQEIKNLKTMQTSVFSPVSYDIFTTLDTPVKPDKVYTKRLVTDNVYHVICQDRLQTFYNISMSQPLNNDIFRAGDTIDIKGTANGSMFQYYVILWGIGENPTEWFSTGMTLVNDGLIGIVNDSLAIWNTSFVTDGDFFTLRLSVNFTNYQREAFIGDIYLDPSLKKGWPQRINFHYDPQSGYYYWGGYFEPVISDINNDGEMEILVYVGGIPPKIYAFKQDGSILEGWPVEVDNEDLPGGNLNSPTVADINNDGYKEIFVNGRAGIYVYNHDGYLRQLINLSLSSQPTSDTVISDLNNDGSPEIIKKFDPKHGGPYYEGGEKIAVLDSNGNMLDNWPQPYLNRTGPDGNSYYFNIVGFESTPAVGNFDDDPEKEIVVASPRNVFDDPANPSGTWHVEGTVFVFNLDGTILTGFPVNINGWIASSPAVGDINNDGYDEIIVGTMKDDDPNSGLYVLDRFGHNATGFPQVIGESIYTSPVVADFNNDGFLEIVVSTIRNPFGTYIFNYRGEVLPGWPQFTEWNDYRSPIVGDINGDNNLDIITTAGNGFIGGGVYAWNFNGTLIEGFPKVTEIDTQASATIADIDNDGKVELIASSDWDEDLETGQYKERGSIYVWELNGNYNPLMMEWPTYHHDNQRTGLHPRPLHVLEIGNITGRLFKVKTSVKNIGGVTINNINWKITLIGGFLLWVKETTDSITMLNPSEEQTITSKLILGFGKIMIKITATIPGDTALQERNATIFLFFIRIK